MKANGRNKRNKSHPSDKQERDSTGAKPGARDDRDGNKKAKFVSDGPPKSDIGAPFIMVVPLVSDS